MNQVATLRNFLNQPLAAAACFAAIMALLMFTIISSLSDVLSRRAEVTASAAMLEQFEGRRATTTRSETGGVAVFAVAGIGERLEPEPEWATLVDGCPVRRRRRSLRPQSRSRLAGRRSTCSASCSRLFPSSRPLTLVY